MVKTTKAQRLAIKRLVDRNNDGKAPDAGHITYKQLRKQIQPYFDKSGCVMVPLWGMWLGIETDGYTHS